MEKLFAHEEIHETIIVKANPHSSLGPSGLKVPRLQAAIWTDLAEDFSMLAQVTFQGDLLPDQFWRFHAKRQLVGLGRGPLPLLGAMCYAGTSVGHASGSMGGNPRTPSAGWGKSGSTS